MALMQREETWTPPRGRRWTMADGRALVAALDARPAGETLAGFARRYGLVAQRVHWWRARVREAEARRPAVRFAPVSVVAGPSTDRAQRPTAPSSSPASVDIVIGRRCVRVRAGFDAELLRRVVSALEEAAPC
jgi:hypothetical protein